MERELVSNLFSGRSQSRSRSDGRLTTGPGAKHERLRRQYLAVRVFSSTKPADIRIESPLTRSRLRGLPVLERRVLVRELTQKLVAAASIAVTVVAVVGPIVVVPAAAATFAASKPSTGVLVSVSAAKKAGFTKVVNAPSTSTNTGVTGCPYGAQEEF